MKQLNYEAFESLFSFAFNLPESPEGLACRVPQTRQIFFVFVQTSLVPLGLWQLPTGPSLSGSVSSGSFVCQRDMSKNTTRVLSAPAEDPPWLLETLSPKAEAPASCAAAAAPRLCLEGSLSPLRPQLKFHLLGGARPGPHSEPSIPLSHTSWSLLERFAASETPFHCVHVYRLSFPLKAEAPREWTSRSSSS